MPIKVEWVDTNPGTTEYVLYKQDTPILDTALPAPLATITAPTKFYLDTATPRGKIFYYRVGSKQGTDMALTPNKALSYLPYTGPGPQAIMRGDLSAGYFGKIPISQLFGQDEIYRMSGLTTGLPVAGLNDTTAYWFKLAYKGKVIYVPNRNLYYSLSFRQLYAAGLVYGDVPEAQWPADIKTRLGTVPQYKTVTKGQTQFLLRLPSTRLDHTLQTNVLAEYTNAEFDYAIAPNHASRTQKPANSYTWGDEGSDTAYSFTMDILGANGLILRGGPGQDTVYASAATVDTTTTALCWRPVLELVL